MLLSKIALIEALYQYLLKKKDVDTAINIVDTVEAYQKASNDSE